jgi:8-oxo-dGTP pyrophosphatase MutT (NUDIX family)
MPYIDRLFQLTFYIAYRLHLAWNFLFRPECHGVWVAVWSQGQLLLIKNAYRSSITLPGGSIDGAEQPVEAALRELREEVGIEAKPQDLVFWAQYLSLVEYKHDHINLFELELPAPPALRLDNREVSWGAISQPEQALAMDLFPTLRIYLQDKQAGRRPGQANSPQSGMQSPQQEIAGPSSAQPR